MYIPMGRIGLKSDGTDDGSLLAARGYANPLYGPSPDEGNVALLRKFLSTVDRVNENNSV